MAKVLVELLTGVHTASVALSTFFEGLLNSADAEAVRGSLDLEPGTDIQAYSARLSEISSGFAAASAGQYPRKNSAGTGIEYGSDRLPLINSVTGATYTFALTDGLASNGFVVANPTADATYTIPLNSSVAFPNNDAIQGRNDSLFNITIEGEAGVTFNTIIVPPGAYFVIQRKAADDWISASTGYPTTSWARINGTVGGLGIISGDGPYKPTGVSRTGVGLYTITIPDTGTTEYGIVVSGRSGPSQGSYVVESGNFTRTSTQLGIIAINAFDGQGNAAQDQNEFVVLIIV